jgi:hypothetical protein
LGYPSLLLANTALSNKAQLNLSLALLSPNLFFFLPHPFFLEGHCQHTAIQVRVVEEAMPKSCMYEHFFVSSFDLVYSILLASLLKLLIT